MQEMMSELSEAEMMQNDMQQLDAALSEAKKQLGEMAGEIMGGDNPGEGEGKGAQAGEGKKNGSWREGQANSKANHGAGKSGNRGRGDGSPSPEEEAVDYKIDKVKAKTQNTGGPIIGSRLVYGDKVKGESVAEFAEVAQNSEQQASEAIENNQVPRELQNAVKTYFGRLNAKVKGEKPATEPAPK